MPAGSGPSTPPTAASRLPLKPQSFACSGVGVGSFGTILLCTPDTHSRWCVTSQIWKFKWPDRRLASGPDTVVRETRKSELTSIREATVRVPKEVVVLTMLSFAPLRTSIPCTMSALHRTAGSALRHSRKEAPRGYRPRDGKTFDSQRGRCVIRRCDRLRDEVGRLTLDHGEERQPDG